MTFITSIQPEAITGSSRMKGGSATKILLEIILWTSLVQACKLSSSTTEGSLSIAALLAMYQRVLDVVKQNEVASAECIKLAGNRYSNLMMIPFDKCDTIKGNEPLVENFDFNFLTPLSQNLIMLHFDANPMAIGYLVTEL